MKVPIIKVNISFLFVATFLIACQSHNEDGRSGAHNQGADFILDRKTWDVIDNKTGNTFSMEIGSPENWKAGMVSSNFFHASHNPDSVKAGSASNFHVIIYRDTLNYDLKRYSNNFIIAEQYKFPGMEFEVIGSENVKSKRRVNFLMDQIKIWGNSEDTLFSVSALAKVKQRIVHLNFYGDYDGKESVENLAKDVVKTVQIYD